MFLSHSSKDSTILKRLSKELARRTNGTVDFFLSSDGESIPFGHNWVATIQDALENAKIMFVFLSPQSMASSWIYFESGFTYAKNVRVIPIAILGLELANVPPPLSLLQGFNINSAESLNNLLRVINSEFDTSFEQSFIEADFKNIFAQTYAEQGEFGIYSSLIDSIKLHNKIKSPFCLALEKSF